MSKKIVKVDVPRKRDDIAERLHALTRQPTKTLSYSHGGLAKSWMKHPKSCNKLEKSSSLPQLRYSISNLKAYEHSFDRFWYCTGSSKTPFWENNTEFKHTVRSEDLDGFSMIGLTGVSRPLFMFQKRTCFLYKKSINKRYYMGLCETNARTWSKYNCTLMDPHSLNKQYLQLSNCVSLNGKFYALSLQGTLVVIEEVDSRMIITHVSSSRAVPSKGSRHFREYLVVSDGAIWLIFLLSRISTCIVDDVEIFRLQTKNIAWKRMERLGKDRAVFIGGKCCLIVAATEVGCKDNCVYFTNRGVDGWLAFDVARGDISPCSTTSMLFGLGSTN